MSISTAIRSPGLQTRRISRYSPGLAGWSLPSTRTFAADQGRDTQEDAELFRASRVSLPAARSPFQGYSVSCLSFSARAVFQPPIQFGRVIESSRKPRACWCCRYTRAASARMRSRFGGQQVVSYHGLRICLAGRFQRIAVAVQRAVERHAGVDAVVERALDDVGEARLAGRRSMRQFHIMLPMAAQLSV